MNVKNQEFFNFGTDDITPPATQPLPAGEPAATLFGNDEPVAPAKPPKKKRAPSRASQKTPERWVPPDDFHLPDDPHEASILRQSALDSLAIGGPRTDLAKFVSRRGDMPPLSGIIAVIRRIAEKISVSRFSVLDSNSPSLLPTCIALYPNAFYYTTYRDEEVEKMTNVLVPTQSPRCIVSGAQCCDFILRPCPVEGESIDDFVRVVTQLNPGGIIAAFVNALSFMDAEPGDNSGEARQIRERLFSGFELMGATRYASDPHTHKSHLDFLVIRRLEKGGGNPQGLSKTGTGYMPWQKANEFYINQPGLIFDSRSLFSDATARLP